MAFPATILDLQAALSLSGTWTDVTSYLYQRNGAVTITRGKPDEASATNPAQVACQVNNRDGRFSPRNPTGTYYGSIGRNTPLRLSVPEGSTYLRMEDDAVSYVSMPDGAGLDPTGAIEWRIDVLPSNYQHPLDTSVRLASKFDAAGQYSWKLEIHAGGYPKLLFTKDGSTEQSATCDAVLPLGRVALKVTYDSATGNVAFYTASSIAGTYTQLGSTQSSGTTGTVFNSTSAVWIGTPTLLTVNGVSVDQSFTGKIFGFRELNGIGGSAVINADFTAATAGSSTYTDATSNVWTVHGTAEFSNRKYRFHGEVPSWPQRWDSTGTDVWAPIQPAGLLRRLGQSGSVLASAMYRGMVRLTGTAAPVGYWPCEDGSGATQLAEATGNGSAIVFTGTPTLAANSSFACSGPLPTIGSSVWHGQIPKYTQPASPSNVFRFLLQIPSGGTTDATEVFRFYTNGSIALVTCTYGTTGSGSLRMQGFDSTGASKFDSGYTDISSEGTGMNGKLMRVSLELQTSGSAVGWDMVGLTAGHSSGTANSGSVASSSVGVATRFTANRAAGSLGSTALGHISFQSTWDTLFDLAGPLEAWASEPAGKRFLRLLFEEGIAYRVVGHPDLTRAMGDQTAKKLTDLLQECEDADGGMLFEPRQALAVGYRTRESLENQAAAVTLSYTAGDLGTDSGTSVEPEDDDQRTRNDVTVTRQDSGSSARATLTSGALSTSAPPSGVGTYPESKTINLYVDSQLDDQAGWRLHVGTVDEPRYPVLPVNLARTELAGNSTKYYGLQDLDQGDYLDVTSLPSWLPPGDLKQLAAGFTERLGGFAYQIDLNCIPESAFEIGVAGSGATSDNRVDTDGSTLSASATSGATSISVATTTPAAAAVCLWTTTAGDFPFDILVGGERMTVTNITGSSSPQTFTVTRSVNSVVKAHSSGEAVIVYDDTIVALDDPY